MNSHAYEGISNPVYNPNNFSVPGLTRLLDAIYYGKQDEVESLLGATPSLLFMNDSAGNDALLVAALYDREKIFKMLIEKYGMSLYKTNSEGRGSLLMAAYAGHLGIVKGLIKLDRHLINQRDRNGNDVILIACLYNHRELIHHLAASYPDKLLTTKNNQGWSALAVAAYSPAVDVVVYLLNNFTWSKDQLLQALNITNSYKEKCNQAPEKWLQERAPLYNQISSLIKQKVQALSDTRPVSNISTLFFSLLKRKEPNQSHASQSVLTGTKT